MNVILRSQLENGRHGEAIYGVCLIKGYSVKLTKTNKEYIEGQLQSGSIINFKAWGTSSAFAKLKSENYEIIPALVQGNFDEYNGNVSIVLNDVVAVEGFTADQFLEEKYNSEAFLNGVKQIISTSVSAKGIELVNKVLFNNEALLSKFAVEFAASYHHDNCKSGLLAHTYKGLCLIPWVLSTYPSLSCNATVDGGLIKSTDRVDLLYIGYLLHDIGKVQEMHTGVYTPISFLTHRVLGLDLLFEFKSDIIEAYGELWFRELEAILVQHHGEYDDKCRTVSSYIIHKIDCFEANMQNLTQSLQDDCRKSPTGLVVSQEDYKLTLPV